MTKVVKRFDLRKLVNGWAVWDTHTSAPAIVEGQWQTVMAMDDANDMTDRLNRLDGNQHGHEP